MSSLLSAPCPVVEFAELPDDEVRRYNAAADAYYREFANADFETTKPWANYREAALISYQTGLLLSGAKIGRAQRILDFGAGGGWLASILHQMGNELFLLDVSPTALDMARETFRRDLRNGTHAVGPHFDPYDGFRFPYADDEFDRIVCFDALHHVPNPLCILKEMHRVLKSGGIAGFVESGERHAELPAIRDCVARTGILERNTKLEEVHLLACKAGFSYMSAKAFPAYDTWEIDYAELARAKQTAGRIVDPGDVVAAFEAGNQSIFMLHKGSFGFDGTYPHEPAATIEFEGASLCVAAGKRARACVRVTNTGETRFNVAPHPLGGFATLGAHLYASDRLADFDFLHYVMPCDIACGETSRFVVEWTAPTEPGHYWLEWDVVIEGVLWLGQLGPSTTRTRLTVSA